MKRKRFGKFTSLFEIIILVVGIIAFAYVLDPKDIVSAQNEICCERTVDGAWCQTANEDQCDTQYRGSPTSCEATSFCKLGCCFDSSEGLCMENTPQVVCEEGEGAWSDSPSCDVPQCNLGCCVLGTQAAFVTLARCKQLSSFYNLETDFRNNIGDELQCISLASLSDQGACVFELDYSKSCKFASRQECNKLSEGIEEGNGTITSNTTFYKDYLCSSDELATSCGPTTRTTCVKGRDELHFLDSCGNPGNIYDSSKINDKAYWNKIVKKEDSCGYQNTNGNVNSKTCGNCDYFYGSMCKAATRNNRATYGENICTNLNCRLSDGTVRLNGETWCYYDTPEKEGSVGSRYFRHVCINGREIIEPCADFRQEVCVKQEIELEEGVEESETFSFAGCVVNRWADCTTQTEKDDCENIDKRDCVWDTSKIANDYKLDVENAGTEFESISSGMACFPKNHPGLEFWNEDSKSTEACAQGTVQFNVDFEKPLVGQKWDPITNEDSVKLDGDGKDVDDWIVNPNWKNKMNKRCGSLGDCGSKINFIGTSGISETGGFTAVISLIAPLIKPVAMIVYYISQGGITSAANEEDEMTVAILGIITTSLLPLGGHTTIYGPLAPGQIATAGGGGLQTSSWGTAWSNVGQVVGTAVVAYFVAQLIGGWIAPDDENFIESFSEAAAVGAAVWKLLELAEYSGKIPTAWGIAAAVIWFVLTYDETDSKKVTFKCLPYEAPIGGNDCERCNIDKYICSEYRCKSLGQACELLNEGTTEEKCTWVNPGDIKSPIISPWQDILTLGYVYVGEGVRPTARGVEIQRETGGECIKAFTPLTFGINTNEPTKCKIEYNHTNNFDNMTYYMGNSNTFKYNHSQILRLPGPSNVNSQGPVIENDGEYNMFVRCQDANGNYNIDEYAIHFCVEKGPDVTPPIVEDTSIENGMPIKYNANSSYLEVYINEPAKCKWSRLDQSYESMENDFDCATRLEQMNAQMLYPCGTNLVGLRNKEDNVYYFRCKDQPTGIEEKDRNTNQNSYEFILKGTQPLNILKVGPNATVSGATTLVSVYLEAETGNGFNFGDSNCYYSNTGAERSYIQMFETGSNKHKQRLELGTGAYSYSIKCVDLGGNTDYKNVSFNVYVDQQAPEVVRIYNYEDKLTIKTNEKSDCSYQTNDETACNFVISEGINMPYSMSTEHATEWAVGKTYYIKCVDESGNEPLPTKCTAKIKTTRDMI